MQLTQQEPELIELELQPLYSKGELVPDLWWQDATPQQARFRLNWLLIISFIIPLALVASYYAFYAADQYMSESQFLVETSASSDGANFASLLQNQKLARASDETFAVANYIQSRDAMSSLVANNELTQVLKRSGRDFLNRFGVALFGDTQEQMFRDYQEHVAVSVSSESGIATLRVYAFSAKDAQDVNAALLKYSEDIVNRLNKRTYDDNLNLAQSFVDEERAKVVDVEERLAQFRNAGHLIDPAKESAGAMAEIGALTLNLAQAEVALSRLMELTPDSPRIQAQQESVASTKAEIEKLRTNIVGDGNSLASKFADYDKLILDQYLAARGLETAIGNMVTARNNDVKQTYYLQRIIQPNLSDEASYPKRLLFIIIAAGIFYSIYWILKSTFQSVMEHAA